MRVLISRKASDYQFVAVQMMEHELSRKVLAAPEVSQLDGGVRRVTERYAWGRVVFTYGPHPSTSVQVLEGVPLDEVQDCVGAVADKDSTDAAECYGDDRSQPCCLLGKCYKVKETARRLGLTTDELMLRYTLEEIEEGKPARKKRPPPRVHGAERRKTQAPVTPGMLKIEKELVDAAMGFFEQVARDLRREIVPGDTSTALARKHLGDGQLYTRDRMMTSCYVGLYAYSEKGWDNPVCVLRPVPLMRAYHVKLPVTEEQLDKLDLEGVTEGYKRDRGDGKSRLGVTISRYPEAKLARLVQLVGRAARRGVFGG